MRISMKGILSATIVISNEQTSIALLNAASCTGVNTDVNDKGTMHVINRQMKNMPVPVYGKYKVLRSTNRTYEY